MTDALKVFIRHTRLRGKQVEPPDNDAQERLIAHIAAWLALAHTHGVETAYKGVERAISIGTPKNWFSKAKEVVSNLATTITETVEGWIDEYMVGEVDAGPTVEEMADFINEKLDEWLGPKAEAIASYEIPQAFMNGMLETFIDMGYGSVQWVADGEHPCPLCQANADQGPVPIGQGWNGLDAPPAHPHCQCSLDVADEPVSRAAQPAQRVSRMGKCTCEICKVHHNQSLEPGKAPPWHEGGCDCKTEEVSI